jgi:hypothetical protein
MKMTRLRIPIAVLAVTVLLVFSSFAMAHTGVATLKANGTPAGPSDAYSPKQTCGGCHFNCATGAYSSDKGTWCTASAKYDCTIPGNCPDYESMATTTVNKIQGYTNSAGKVAFMNYAVTVPAHGASTGKHSTEGRNEEQTAAQRSIWGAPASISSPGMWGRF